EAVARGDEERIAVRPNVRGGAHQAGVRDPPRELGVAPGVVDEVLVARVEEQQGDRDPGEGGGKERRPLRQAVRSPGRRSAGECATPASAAGAGAARLRASTR